MRSLVLLTSSLILFPPVTIGSVYAQDTGSINELLQLVNAERSRNGLRPLQLSPQLNQAAQSHAQSMNTNNYFNHRGIDGSSPTERAQRAGYRSGVGENIAYGVSSAQDVFKLWMNSPGHRSNILNPSYTDLGLGISSNYWVQNFGLSQPLPQTNNSPNTQTTTTDNSLSSQQRLTGITIQTYSQPIYPGYSQPNVIQPFYSQPNQTFKQSTENLGYRQPNLRMNQVPSNNSDNFSAVPNYPQSFNYSQTRMVQPSYTQTTPIGRSVGNYYFRSVGQPILKQNTAPVTQVNFQNHPCPWHR